MSEDYFGAAFQQPQREVVFSEERLEVPVYEQAPVYEYETIAREPFAESYVEYEGPVSRAPVVLEELPYVAEGPQVVRVYNPPPEFGTIIHREVGKVQPNGNYVIEHVEQRWDSFGHESWDLVIKPIGVGVVTPIAGLLALVGGTLWGCLSIARGVLGTIPLAIDWVAKPILGVFDTSIDMVDDGMKYALDGGETQRPSFQARPMITGRQAGSVLRPALAIQPSTAAYPRRITSEATSGLGRSSVRIGEPVLLNANWSCGRMGEPVQVSTRPPTTEFLSEGTSARVEGWSGSMAVETPFQLPSSKGTVRIQTSDMPPPIFQQVTTGPLFQPGFQQASDMPPPIFQQVTTGPLFQPGFQQVSTATNESIADLVHPQVTPRSNCSKVTLTPPRTIDAYRGSRPFEPVTTVSSQSGSKPFEPVTIVLSQSGSFRENYTPVSFSRS